VSPTCPAWIITAVVALVALTGTMCRAEGMTSGKDRFVASIEITGPIGPATVTYVKDALATASQRQAEAVILRLNTPGGLATSMRAIIAEVLASPVPIIGFVSPAGAHAASAGTYILYATHVAAMAPGTNLGAATPVQIGGPPAGLSPQPGKDGGTGRNGDDSTPPKDAMTAKVTNDAVAFIRSLAELRHRNADWAEQAVREAASLSSQAALDKGVIDLIARTPEDLLSRPGGSQPLASRSRRLSPVGSPASSR
jgi:membrane-bound serine protease (ClpP class)